MSEPWFGKKRIGFGYRPINLMGWLVTLVFTVVIIGGGLWFLESDPPNPLAFIVLLVVALVVLFLVIRAKLETTQ